MYKNYKDVLLYILQIDLYCCTYLPLNVGCNCAHKYTRGLNKTQFGEVNKTKVNMKLLSFLWVKSVYKKQEKNKKKTTKIYIFLGQTVQMLPSTSDMTLDALYRGVSDADLTHTASNLASLAKNLTHHECWTCSNTSQVNKKWGLKKVGWRGGVFHAISPCFKLEKNKSDRPLLIDTRVYQKHPSSWRLPPYPIYHACPEMTLCSLLSPFLVMVVVLWPATGRGPFRAAVLLGLLQELVQTEGILFKLDWSFPSLTMISTWELFSWNKSDGKKNLKKKLGTLFLFVPQSSK